MIQQPNFEESSGNVFADLGLENPQELFNRGKIGIQVLRLLKKSKLKRSEISQFLNISPSEVSALIKGEFQRFNDDQMLNFLALLDNTKQNKQSPKTAGTNLVLLDPDVAQAFPTSDSVNEALRLLMQIAQRQKA
jgi:predicted XRE-type DNA-binding protein